MSSNDSFALSTFVEYISNLPQGYNTSKKNLGKKLKIFVTDELLEKANEQLEKKRIVPIGQEIRIFAKGTTDNPQVSPDETEQEYKEDIRKNELTDYKDSVYYKLIKTDEEKKTELYSTFSFFIYDDINHSVHKDGYLHELEQVIVRVKDSKGNKVYGYMFHCKTCNKFIMSKKELDRMKLSTKNKLFLPIEFDYYYGVIQKEIEKRGFKTIWRTKLTNFNYNAKVNGLNPQERKEILYNVIKNSQMTKEEVLDNLQYFIEHLGKQNEDARKIWEDDIEYVKNAVIEPVKHKYKIFYDIKNNPEEQE